jgi:co-chaperonin GroES (HSP10)
LNIQPLADHVVIKPSEESEEKTKSGLYVPDTAKEKPQEGQVIAVGPGALNDKGDNRKRQLVDHVQHSVQTQEKGPVLFF